jgi:hypothetical protein
LPGTTQIVPAGFHRSHDASPGTGCYTPDPPQHIGCGAKPGKENHSMRILIATTALAIACLASSGAAKADPYRWCAQNADSGSTNCYFETIEQCQATASSSTMFCTPNTFYTGPDAPAPHAQKRKH